METNNTFSFNYQIVNDITSEMIHMGAIALELNDKELVKVTRAITDNGGFAVSLPEITWLDERVGRLAMDDFLCNYAGDDFDWDDARLILDEELPQELVDAATEKYDNLIVDCHFYFMKDGKEQMQTMQLGVTRDVFQAMIDVVKLGRTIGTDFDNLKEVNPEAYAHSGECALEYAFKWGMTHYECDIHAYLKEFPYQVYENVTL